MLRTRFTLTNISRALAGGVNDATGFTRWLDNNLFQGATFAEFRRDRRPWIWINAADIYNRTTFVFGQTAFSAMCSDLEAYPIADAVAASAAVPVVFAPVVIQTFAGSCGRRLPEWIERARNDTGASPIAQGLCHRDRPIQRRLDALHQAARRRLGRQLRSLRIHDRAPLIQYPLWAAHAAAGGEAAPSVDHGRRRGTRPVGQLGPDHPGPVRSRTGFRGR